MGALRWCIRPRLAWAEMLRERAGAGDIQRAERLCAEALEGAREFGCPGLARRAEAGLSVASRAER